jgi:RIO kinase 1
MENILTMSSRNYDTSDYRLSNQTHTAPRANARSRLDYEYYEELYDPDAPARPRPSVKPKNYAAKVAAKAKVVSDLTDEAIGLEAGFTTTYQPGRHEEGWLIESLNLFYANDLLSDILALVKGGKEATVYRCRGTHAAGHDIVAAKVFRPRKFRNLRNDKMYKEGRLVLNANGRPVKATDHRLIRALNKKSAFGQQVEHTSWLMYEFTTLQRLHAAGLAVPEPIASSENAILMQHIGDEQITAPTLNEVSLPVGEARPLFHKLLEQVEGMLSVGLIHGDLSAYNILYWEGDTWLIDFPQVTDSVANSRSRSIFFRDVQRVCEYFALQGVESNPRAIAAAMWNRFETRREVDRLADLSRHQDDTDTD